MVLNNDPKVKGRTDISDLDSDPIVVFQHKHYGKLLLFTAWIFPAMVAGLGWGDWWGGFVYAGIIRACFVQQATFCVNSLAHWIGEQPFDDRRSPRDHVLTALVTMGEGYHNFHHEFPSDYRKLLFPFRLAMREATILMLEERKCDCLVPVRSYEMAYLDHVEDPALSADIRLENLPLE